MDPKTEMSGAYFIQNCDVKSVIDVLWMWSRRQLFRDGEYNHCSQEARLTNDMELNMYCVFIGKNLQW